MVIVGKWSYMDQFEILEERVHGEMLDQVFKDEYGLASDVLSCGAPIDAPFLMPSGACSYYWGNLGVTREPLPGWRDKV